MKKKHQNKKITLLQMLFIRKWYYVLGLIIGIACMGISYVLGEPSVKELWYVPFSMSFIFGHACYYIHVHKNNWKWSDRYEAIISREGLMNFGLTFGSMIIFGLIFGAS